MHAGGPVLLIECMLELGGRVPDRGTLGQGLGWSVNSTSSTFDRRKWIER